ncbi:DUF1905 domain-containing protein [Mycetocola zhadangensis]|uniref:DUF1905 domain-containing protein n=1 Tax=Mycetocola zhadangensis TaxID=1164595 RepID=UPI003A4D6585
MRRSQTRDRLIPALATRSIRSNENYGDAMDISFRGTVWYWRGPSPFHFVTVPADESEIIAELAPAVTYGWGMIPVTVRIGRTGMTTSLWPKDGGYIVPLKKALREREGVELGDAIDVTLSLSV